jgi:hypothetical protein
MDFGNKDLKKIWGDSKLHPMMAKVDRKIEHS